jgi:hypothetical protein
MGILIYAQVLMDCGDGKPGPFPISGEKPNSKDLMQKRKCTGTHMLG